MWRGSGSARLRGRGGLFLSLDLPHPCALFHAGSLVYKAMNSYSRSGRNEMIDRYDDLDFLPFELCEFVAVSKRTYKPAVSFTCMHHDHTPPWPASLGYGRDTYR